MFRAFLPYCLPTSFAETAMPDTLPVRLRIRPGFSPRRNAQTEIVFVVSKATIDVRARVGWRGGPSNEFVHVDAAAIPVWRLIRATVRHITRNDEDTALISRRGRQDHDGEPVKFVLVVVRDKVPATAEVSRLNGDSLQTPFGALADHVEATLLTRDDKGRDSMQGKFGRDQHFARVAHLLFREPVKTAP